jgi:hypothetical protein
MDHPGQRIKAAIDRAGFAIQEGVISSEMIDSLICLLGRHERGESLERQGKVFAIRNLLEQPEIAELAGSSRIRTLIEAVLGGVFFPVRGILFDKLPTANWKVPWHQDVTIAVRNRFEVSGFGPWSMKAGVLHVQPPAAVMEKMVSIRLHLDACNECNGALRVIPGSHRYGRIPENRLQAILQSSEAHVCNVNRGGALLMRPLLLHASSPSLSPAHRRVIHLDFASEMLPTPLQWLSERVEKSTQGTAFQ